MELIFTLFQERSLVVLKEWTIFTETYLANSEVGRPKIVRPLRDTVSFIYASECNLRKLRNRRQTTISRATSNQGLRRKEQNRHLSRTQVLNDLLTLGLCEVCVKAGTFQSMRKTSNLNNVHCSN